MRQTKSYMEEILTALLLLDEEGNLDQKHAEVDGSAWWWIESTSTISIGGEIWKRKGSPAQAGCLQGSSLSISAHEPEPAPGGDEAADFHVV